MSNEIKKYTIIVEYKRRRYASKFIELDSYGVFTRTQQLFLEGFLDIEQNNGEFFILTKEMISNGAIFYFKPEDEQ